jgi:hypothetical protein
MDEESRPANPERSFPPKRSKSVTFAVLLKESHPVLRRSSSADSHPYFRASASGGVSERTALLYDRYSSGAVEDDDYEQDDDTQIRWTPKGICVAVLVLAAMAGICWLAVILQVTSAYHELDSTCFHR